MLHLNMVEHWGHLFLPHDLALIITCHQPLFI